MKIIYRLFTCAMFLFCTFLVNEALAVPAKPGPVTITQPDGSKLTIRLYGDEFAHYTTTDDGYGIYQAEDGFYYYIGAKAANGKVRAKDASARTASDRQAMAGATMGVPYGEMQLKRDKALSELEAINNSAEMQRFREARQASMTSGEKFKSVVILVNFQDVRFTTENAQSEFSKMLNEPNYTKSGVSSAGSAWDYYHENSMGAFDPQFDVFGPYTVSQTMAYYGAPKGNSNDTCPEEMVIEACQLASADGVDFSQYAINGTAKDVFVFYAGYGQSDGADENTIWPHRWFIYRGAGKNIMLNGVRIDGYACASELRLGRGNMAGIGTFCHEYGHVLGLPDYYATNYASVLTPSTYFLMDAGSHNDDGRTPPSLSAINRYLLGWIEPETLDISNPANYELPHISENKAYIIRISDTGAKGEYFTLETRSSDTNKWDGGLRKVNSYYATGARNGLFMMHIDRRTSYLSRWSGNYLNNTATHPCAHPVRASGTTIERTQQRWVFPYSDVTAVSQSSHGDFKSWTGTNDVELVNIAYNNGTVSFDVAGIVMDENEITLYASESKDLTLTSYSDKNAGYTLEWTSSNPNIASVDQYGKVTGVAEGTVTITATAQGKPYTTSCEVVVLKGIGDVRQSINQNDAEFSWDQSSDGSVTGYKVEVANSSDVVVFSETVQGNSVYIQYLIPGRTYTFKLAALSGTDVLYDTVIYFSTSTVKGEYPYMNIKGSYGSSDMVPLRILDVKSEIASIVWKVDGKQVTPPAVKLTSGRHEITATVTTKDNNVETITKFVNIQ